MNLQIKVPTVGESITEVTIGQWLKKEGDEVVEGDDLLNVITDKADFEIKAETSGTLLKIVAQEKSSVPINFVVAVVGAEGETLPDYEKLNDEVRQQSVLGDLEESAPEPPKPAAVQPIARGKRVPATPAARRLAQEHGFELTEIRDWAKAAGPVTQEMVEQFINK